MPNAPPTHGDTCLIVQVLENHCAHTLLLPFVFDAIASLIVGNQDNGRKVRREAGLVAGGGWLGLARTGLELLVGAANKHHAPRTTRLVIVPRRVDL